MSVYDNKNMIRRFWEDVFNKKNLNLIDSLFSNDWIYHGTAGQEVRGPEGLKQFLTIYFNACPELQARIEDLIAEEDRVVSRVTMRGTHKGDLMGIPPLGKEISITAICISRLSGGKIVEDWELVDMYGMPQQLGVISQKKE